MLKVCFVLSIAAGCNRTAAVSEWPTAQLDQYIEECAVLAADIFNTPSAIRLRGAMDVKAICQCSLRGTERLFLSYGHWRLAADKTTETSKLLTEYSDYGLCFCL